MLNSLPGSQGLRVPHQRTPHFCWRRTRCSTCLRSRRSRPPPGAAPPPVGGGGPCSARARLRPRCRRCRRRRATRQAGAPRRRSATPRTARRSLSSPASPYCCSPSVCNTNITANVSQTTKRTPPLLLRRDRESSSPITI